MRIGVNIPNDLLQRLEPLKPRMNVSEICREAITKHVENYEKAIVHLEDDATMAALEQAIQTEIEHWAEVEPEWEDLGYQDAVDWVAKASWKDWEEWRGILDLLERQGRPPWDIQPTIRRLEDKVVKTFSDREWEFREKTMRQSDEYLDWRYYHDIHTDWDAAEREYGRAWFTYVNQAWQLICQRRDEHLENQRRQRDERRKNRPLPTIPDQLLNER